MNYKRVRRVYLLLGMNRRRKVRRRVPARVKVPLVVPERARETCSMDFMSDVLTSKRKFRTLNIIDDYNREAITVEAAHTMPANRVTQILERTIHEQGKPNCMRVDNGPEFNSKEFKDWCAIKGITAQFTQPGKPMHNGYIERFNRTFRENRLDAYLFEDIYQVQVLADELMEDYNHNRPHEAFGGITPDLYKRLNCGDIENSIEFQYPHSYNVNNYIFELNKSIKHQSNLGRVTVLIKRPTILGLSHILIVSIKLSIGHHQYSKLAV